MRETHWNKARWKKNAGMKSEEFEKNEDKTGRTKQKTSATEN